MENIFRKGERMGNGVEILDNDLLLRITFRIDCPELNITRLNPSVFSDHHSEIRQELSFFLSTISTPEEAVDFFSSPNYKGTDPDRDIIGVVGLKASKVRECGIEPKITNYETGHVNVRWDNSHEENMALYRGIWLRDAISNGWQLLYE